MLLVAVYTLYGLEGGALPPRPGVGLGGLVPRAASAVSGGLVPCTESAVLGGLPFTPLTIAIFAHTGHILGLTTFLLLRGDSSLVFLHPSPPSIAAPAAGGLCLQPTTIRFGLRRTHRGRHVLAEASAAATSVAQPTLSKESCPGD